MIIIYNDIQETIILYNLSTTNNNTDNHNNNIDIISIVAHQKLSYRQQ